MTKTKTSHHANFCTALAGLIGAASLMAAVPSSAQSQDPPSKVVRFADLDIGTAAGAKLLYHRIHAAAEYVCKTDDPIMREAVKACIDQAVDKAVLDVHAPMLTELRFGSRDVRLARR